MNTAVKFQWTEILCDQTFTCENVLNLIDSIVSRDTVLLKIPSLASFLSFLLATLYYFLSSDPLPSNHSFFYPCILSQIFSTSQLFFPLSAKLYSGFPTNTRVSFHVNSFHPDLQLLNVFHPIYPLFTSASLLSPSRPKFLSEMHFLITFP